MYMRRAALALLAVAALAFLLMVSNIAVVGPCTDTFGAAVLFAFILGAPIGLILLLWSLVRSRRKESSAPTQLLSNK
jgi:hypothetical protein